MTNCPSVRCCWCRYFLGNAAQKNPVIMTSRPGGYLTVGPQTLGMRVGVSGLGPSHLVEGVKGQGCISVWGCFMGTTRVKTERGDDPLTSQRIAI